MPHDPPMQRSHARSDEPGVVRLFAGMVTAPFAWAIQLLIAYAVAAYACYPTDVALSVPIWPHLRTIVIVETGATWVLLGAGCAIAWSNWKATRGAVSAGPDAIVQSGDGRTRFMALCGVLVSAVFAIALLFTSVGAFMVPDCGP